MASEILRKIKERQEKERDRKSEQSKKLKNFFDKQKSPTSYGSKYVGRTPETIVKEQIERTTSKKSSSSKKSIPSTAPEIPTIQTSPVTFTTRPTTLSRNTQESNTYRLGTGETLGLARLKGVDVGNLKDISRPSNTQVKVTLGEETLGLARLKGVDNLDEISKPVQSRYLYLGGTKPGTIPKSPTTFTIRDTTSDVQPRVEQVEQSPYTVYSPPIQKQIDIVERTVTPSYEERKQRETTLSELGYGQTGIARTGLGFGMQQFQRQPVVSGFQTQNPMQDYAQRFFKKQKVTQDVGYEKAQSAVDNLLGKDITSGKNFRKAFGDPIKRM